MVGLGKNIWPNVEIHERKWNPTINQFASGRVSIFSNLHMLNCVFPWITVGDLYNHLFDAVVVSSSLPSTPGHGREGYYFGANEEHTLYQVGKSISDVMLKMHKSNGGEPTTFTQEEINKYFNVSLDFNPSFISSMLTKFNNLSSFRAQVTWAATRAVDPIAPKPLGGRRRRLHKICWIVFILKRNWLLKLGHPLCPRNFDLSYTSVQCPVCEFPPNPCTTFHIHGISHMLDISKIAYRLMERGVELDFTSCSSAE